MLRIFAAVTLLLQLFCGYPQGAADALEGQRPDTFYTADRGYALWYDASKMAPVADDAAYDVFLPLDGEAAAAGVSFAVYELGYDDLIPLPGARGSDACVLDLYAPDGLYAVDDAYPALADALADAGYLCVAEDVASSADGFGAAYALYGKDGMYAAVHITELASGTYLVVLTYPQGAEETWGAWLEEMAATFTAVGGI